MNKRYFIGAVSKRLFYNENNDLMKASHHYIQNHYSEHKNAQNAFKDLSDYYSNQDITYKVYIKSLPLCVCEEFNRHELEIVQRSWKTRFKEYMTKVNKLFVLKYSNYHPG